ncbi:MAG: GNAT family N-acetyltransferase [Chloroflexota bacterium]
MAELRIVDVTDEATFRLVPPCADPGFDHRSCDYWEDAERGSKAARLSWLEPGPGPSTTGSTGTRNPFGQPDDEPVANPFAPGRSAAPAPNPFAVGADRITDNPFAPPPPSRPTFGPDQPRKLSLFGRGLGVFGSYAKVLLIDEVAAVYAQFGPLSAYPRALRLRELYPQLPDAPLPAVITCIATTRSARGSGHARRLVEAVCDDLAERGFAAVEAYPEAGAPPDATSGATPGFWQTAGFLLAVPDERFPVVRRELG